MPELAEVELLRRGLASVVGARVLEVSTESGPRFSPAERVVGGTFTDVARQGKWLSLSTRFDDGGIAHLGVHLGMTGQLTLCPPAPVPTKWRCRLLLSEERSLFLADSRGFGRLRVTDEPFEGLILGPEPGEASFNPALVEAISRSSAPVFAVLLDQHRLSGIGSYVAQEGLWRAGINPTARSVPKAQVGVLATMLEDVVNDSLRTGGMTMRDYRRLDGSVGDAFGHLDCYGRSGSPCRKCGDILQKTRVAGRGVTWCPRCQA